MMYRSDTPKRSRPKKTPHLSKAKRTHVSRDEYNYVIDLLNERGRIIDGINRTLEIQFQRMAQMQAELDEVRAWTRMKFRVRSAG
jgi:hypothetical protein